MLHDPDLIILDEPFSGLDPVNAALLSSIIGDLHKEGKTIVFSTHVLHQAEQLCHRIFLINQGTKLLDDDLATIRKQFRQRIVSVTLAEHATLPELSGVTAKPDPRDQRCLDLHLASDQDETEVMRRVIECTPITAIAVREPRLEEIFTQLVAAESHA